MSAAAGVNRDWDNATGSGTLLSHCDDTRVRLHYELWAFVGWPTDFRQSLFNSSVHGEVVDPPSGAQRWMLAPDGQYLIEERRIGAASLDLLWSGHFFKT